MSDEGSREVRFRDFGRAGPVAIAAAAMPALGGFALLGFMPQVTKLLYGLGPIGDALYVALFALFSGFAILPTYAQAALGGYTYGFWGGTLGAMAGILGGSLIGYLAARRVAGDDVNRLIDRHPKWRVVRDSFFPQGGGISGVWKTLGIVILIRFPPNSPFALTNLLLASVRVPIPIYAVGTVIGILPRTALLVTIGWLVQGTISAAAVKDARPGWLFPVGIALTIGVIVFLAWLGDKAIKKAVAAGEIAADADDEASQVDPE